MMGGSVKPGYSSGLARVPLCKLADLGADIAAAAAATDTAPSKAQAEAGNYRKGRFVFHGLTIAIENPRGSTREGVDKNGKPWKNTLAAHYGHILAIPRGKDGDNVDCFVGEDLASDKVYVINQVDPGTGKLDEHKVVVAAADEAAAKKLYLDSYAKGWKGLGSIAEMTLAEFDDWAREGDHGKEAHDAGVPRRALVVGGEGPGTEDRSNVSMVGWEPDGCWDGGDDDQIPGFAEGKEAADEAVGLPRRRDYGDLSQFSPGDVVDWFTQQHDALRAGPHLDARFGTPESKLFSWATRRGLPGPGERRLAVQQALHRHGYGTWSGEIPAGQYGGGRVTAIDQGKLMITGVSPDKITFARIDKKRPEQFALIRPRGRGYRERDWLLVNTTDTTPADLPEKVHYKTIPAEQVEEALAKLEPGSSVQAKIDGASSLVELGEHGVRVLSARPPKSGPAIEHTLRVFGGPGPRPEIPAHLRGTRLLGEIYARRNRPAAAAPVQDPARGGAPAPAAPGAARDGAAQQDGGGPAAGAGAGADAGAGARQVLPAAQLGGLLNASVEHSLAKQRDLGAQLGVKLFNVQRVGGRAVDPGQVPYAARRRMMQELLPYLGDRFELAEEAEPGKELELWKRISEGRHPETREGVVIHSPVGVPTKIVTEAEHDIPITGTFPGQGWRSGVVGGLTYDAGGKTGRVGTGFSQEDLKDIAANPDQWIGRTARIRAKEQLPSGLFRSPVFLARHEG